MTTEAQIAKPTTKKAKCSRCMGVRICDIRGHYLEKYDDGFFQENTDWHILECRGCELVFIQTCSTNSEDFDHVAQQDGSVEAIHPETTRYWPALFKRQRPEWFTVVGIDADNVNILDNAMEEVYGALNNDLHMLSGIGIRTCFDVASELLGVDKELSFEKKLDKLVADSRINTLDRERLATLINAGSASAHRGWRPSVDDISIMMEILEHFIYDAFVNPSRKKQLDEKVSKVKITIPTRKGNAINAAKDKKISEG
jgi:hypothetical protein